MILCATSLSPDRKGGVLVANFVTNPSLTVGAQTTRS